MKTQHYIRSAFIILGLLLLQTTFVPLISLGGCLPDILILYLVYIGLRRGQIEATITGFVIGLLQDVVTIKFFGLAALSKTIAGFVLGYFFNENTIEQTLSSYRYLLLIALCSAINNIIYFIIFFQGTEGSVIVYSLEWTLGITLYTCVIGALPMFLFYRKYNSSSLQ
jgi:rod shape-determining protein MreD